MIANVKSSTENIKKIQQQFEEVIKYSQDYSADASAIFDKWFEAKRDYIEAWGGQLIWECPELITFELSPNDKNSRLDDFISIVANTFDNESLACFLDDNREGFFRNEVVADGDVRLNDDSYITIPKGMKIIKAFKYFEEDPFTLKELQTQASMIIQEDKISGTLCFSVHPLDFLSSSENTYKWRSCHALDGEYRAGNLSYMMDKSTIMCYLRGAEEVKLPNFPDTVLWNSKKWRMLLFFSENWDVLFAGRQYPFFSRGALDVVSERLTARIMSGRWSHWHDDRLTTFDYKEDNSYDGGALAWNYICIANELYRLSEVVVDDTYSLHFNDLLRSSCYKPYYCFKYYRPIAQTPIVKVGGQVPCAHCGRNHLVATDSMLCDECELDFGNSQDDRYGYCDCCDRRILMDSGNWVYGTGQLVCDYCIDTVYGYCENCDRAYYKEDLIYDREKHVCLCENCSTRGRLSAIADIFF